MTDGFFSRLFTEDGELEVTICDGCGRLFYKEDKVFVNDAFGDVLCDRCYEDEDGYSQHSLITEKELIENAF